MQSNHTQKTENIYEITIVVELCKEKSQSWIQLGGSLSWLRDILDKNPPFFYYSECVTQTFGIYSTPASWAAFLAFCLSSSALWYSIYPCFLKFSLLCCASKYNIVIHAYNICSIIGCLKWNNWLIDMV